VQIGAFKQPLLPREVQNAAVSKKATLIGKPRPGWCHHPTHDDNGKNKNDIEKGFLY
jgi:hypothetical protein